MAELPDEGLPDTNEPSLRTSLDSQHQSIVTNGEDVIPTTFINGKHRESSEISRDTPELEQLKLSDDPLDSGLSNGVELSEKEMELQKQLVKVTSEKESFEAQYRSLLGKLTTMRSTLGDKLRQDADELDLRAQQIAILQATNEDLNYTVETLRSELITSNEDLDHAQNELEASRHRAFDSQRQTSDEAMARESALRELQEDLESSKMDLEEWKGEAGRERVAREAHAQAHAVLERELLGLKSERDSLRSERDTHAESAANLHNVLEEFQAAKDQELKETLGDLQTQLLAMNKSLADYKQRAATAEAKVAESHSDSERLISLQQEVKEKNLLIGKLRHEGVILNEHLTEALKRLKKDTSENNVDRRLITNVLISFFNTPRSDTKRFEMLSLLASILSWSDEDRERAGLQKSNGSTLNVPSSTSPSAPRVGRHRGHTRSNARGRPAEGDLVDTESFSNLWIEFLLREANQSPSSASTLQPNQWPSSNSTTSPSSAASYNPNSRFPLPEIPASPTSPSPSSSTRRPSFSSAVSSTGPSSIAPSVASRAASTVGEATEKG